MPDCLLIVSEDLYSIPSTTKKKKLPNNLVISYSAALVGSIHPLIRFLRRILAMFIVVISDIEEIWGPSDKNRKRKRKQSTEQVDSFCTSCSRRGNEAIPSMVGWPQRWLWIRDILLKHEDPRSSLQHSCQQPCGTRETSGLAGCQPLSRFSEKPISGSKAEWESGTPNVL